MHFVMLNCSVFDFRRLLAGWSPVSVVICGMDVGSKPPSDRTYFPLLFVGGACGYIGIKCDLAGIPAKFMLSSEILLN